MNLTPSRSKQEAKVLQQVSKKQKAVSNSQSPSGRLKKNKVAQKSRKFESRDDAIAALERRRSLYLSLARKHAIEIAVKSLTKTVTIDDVRQACPPPKDIDPRVMGAVFSERGTWRSVGWENSKRKTCHKRPIQRFELRSY